MVDDMLRSVSFIGVYNLYFYEIVLPLYMKNVFRHLLINVCMCELNKFLLDREMNVVV